MWKNFIANKRLLHMPSRKKIGPDRRNRGIKEENFKNRKAPSGGLAAMKYLLAIMAIIAVVWLMPQPAPYRLEVAPGGMERIAKRIKAKGAIRPWCEQTGIIYFYDKKGRVYRL
jgi:hypothetical protein